MKILRWLIAIVFALIVIAAIVVVLLVNFINPNNYRDQINQTISEKIHKPFAIQGDISWVFFPSLGFKAQDMTVGDKQSKDLYAQLKTLEINLQILPLLHKQIALNALQVDGLTLLLPPEAPSTTAAKSASPAGALLALPQLSLKDFSIKNANITQPDANGKTAWAIRDLTLDSSNLTLNQEFPIKLAFNFSNPASNISAKINFDTTINWNGSAQTITLNSPKLMVDNDKGSAFPGQLNLAMKNLVLDINNYMATLTSVSGNFNQLNFTGNVKATNLNDTPLATGDINLTSTNLKALLASLNVSMPAMQSANALTQFSLSSNFQYGNNQLKLMPLNIKLDDTTMSGSLQSPDVKSLAMNLALQVSNINLANYLAPAPQPRTISLENTKINLNVLPPAGADKNWLASTATGTVSSQSLNFNGQKFNNIAMQLDAKDQVFKLVKFHTEAWQGKVDGNALVNMQGSSPRFSVSPTVQNIQIEQLMQIAEPKFKITGLANLSGSISSEGSDAATITRNLNGNLRVAVSNGVLHGFDLGYWLNVGSAILQKQTPPAQSQAAKQTPFGNLTATLAINNGVVNNQDLLMQGPVGQAKGDGTINLVSETLNYHLQLVKTNQATGKAHSDIIPLLITGSFDNPSIQPDMAALAKQAISKQGDKLVQKVIGDKLGDNQLSQQVSGVIGKLLG